MRFIETFKDGDRISDVYLCKSKSTALTKTGKEYEKIDFDVTEQGIRQ